MSAILIMAFTMLKRTAVRYKAITREKKKKKKKKEVKKLEYSSEKKKHYMQRS